MDYINKFDTFNQYIISGASSVKPGASWVMDENKIYFNEWFETDFIAEFDLSGEQEDKNVKLVGVLSETAIFVSPYYSGTILIDGESYTIPSSYRPDAYIPGGTPQPIYYTMTAGAVHTVRYPSKNVYYGVPENSFNGCADMTKVTIPEATTRILDGTFSGCTSLLIVICRSTTPPTLYGNPFPTGKWLGSIYVPDDSLDAYKLSWDSQASRIHPMSDL